MKRIFSVATIAFAMVACNTNPKTTVTTTTTTDTTGLAKFQEWRAQQVRDSIALVNQSAQAAYAHVTPHSSNTTTSSKRRTYSGSSSRSNNSTATTTMSSESSAAAKKRGWSKTAKGAVIGGVAGAGAGAIINKKNRGAGAVIGGVVGAGAGAIIGHEKDKKDGRH